MPQTIGKFIENAKKYLTKDDLRSICLDLDVNYEPLEGRNWEEKLISLIEELKPQQRLPELSQACQERRPNIDWSIKQNHGLPSKKTDFMDNLLKTKILFLAANPSDTTRLSLDEEIREIEEALRQAKFRTKFNIEQQWAVRVTDLQGCLLRHQPDIVHFSGHGSRSSELILQDSTGNSYPVSVKALGHLFSILRDNIRCVVLNACYSEQQAQIIAQYIDCVIGMSKSIGDLAAINFSKAFYQALGYGKDVKTAFELGCNQLDLVKLNEQDTPKLLALRCNPQEIVFMHREATF